MHINEFYVSKDVERFPPDGRIDVCKKCLTMHVNNWEPDTFMDILEKLDIPYVKQQWDALLERYGSDPNKPLKGTSILGRYISTMKLSQYAIYRFKHTAQLAEDQAEIKKHTLKAAGLTDEEIEAQLAFDAERKVPRPDYTRGLGAKTDSAKFDEQIDSTFVDEFEDQLTDEDKLYLRMKWGTNYSYSELVRLEQLYKDFEKSYDIQGAGMVDTLIMICKASFRANQLIDGGDKH